MQKRKENNFYNCETQHFGFLNEKKIENLVEDKHEDIECVCV